MSNLRAVCRPHTVFSSIACCYRDEVLARCRSINTRVSIRRPNSNPQLSSPSVFSPWFDASDLPKVVPWVRTNQRRRTMVKAANWAEEKSPYETLELERNADDENIKVAYRRLAKFYHPDVYNGKGTLEDGETAEARFIKIQAAYELLIDDKRRRDYDIENRVNPMKASQAWTDWVMKKRKAFDQRGDMAIAAWAELQQQELNIRARRLSRSKIDPDEERRIMARERKASMDYYNSTLKRHTLVLRKRDIMRRKAEEDQKSILSKLLAAEGLELAKEDDDDDKPRLK